MSKVQVCSIMDEIQDRIERLRSKLPVYDKKRLVIYGTGLNASRILHQIPELNVLGLMDEGRLGKVIYGKKVLSEKEIQLLEIDTILLATEPHSTPVVYHRIFDFCRRNGIEIIDMCGCDENEMRRYILEQQLSYEQLNRQYVQSVLENKDIVIVEAEGVLCSEIETCRENVYKKIENFAREECINIENFTRNRILAEQRLLNVKNAGLKDIYTVFSSLTSIDSEEVEKLRHLEERAILENLIPRKTVIGLLKEMIDRGKTVYIRSELKSCETVLDHMLRPYGIVKGSYLCADSGSLEVMTCRTLLSAGKKAGFEKLLYIGCNRKESLILPQMYGIEMVFLKEADELFEEYSKIKIDVGDRENILTETVRKKILTAYDSPFLEEIDLAENDIKIGREIGWFDESVPSAPIEIVPICHRDKLEEYDKLFFAEARKPIVSIIIPAFNQFEYTYNCLYSILHNTENVAYEVILADDCSEDNTKEIDKIVHGITVIHNAENLLFLKNCNHAAQKARGKYLLFLNNDTQVQFNWLYPLVLLMERNAGAGMAGSKLVFSDGRLQEAGGIIWNDGSGWNYGRGKNPFAPEYSYVREADYISGASIIISRKLWNEIGGFDERFAPAYCEDSDLAFEVRKHGKKVLFQPDSVVVHFEGISNGTNVDSGIKKYQVENKEKFYRKWRETLLKEQKSIGQNVLSASDRKGRRKTVLFVSKQIPTYDQDAGSRTLYFYIKEFVARGYLVKLIPDMFVANEPYTHELQQMGVEVLVGKHYENNIFNWIQEFHEDIDFAFLNYPDVARKYIDILNRLGIKVRFYGMDLHYLRNKREYELFGGKDRLKLYEHFYQMEKYIIQNSEIVYYPSVVETDIVRKEFHKQEVRQLIAYIYDLDHFQVEYVPVKRRGLLFIGGYRHTPNVDAVMWFAEKIYPLIYEKEKIPFYIAGVDMPTEIRNLDVPGIVKVGALSDTELEEMYARVKMVVVPLRYGAGIKGKVIEAMYHAVPVVTTSVGMEGIPNEENAARIADDERGIAEAVVELYQKDEELQRMSHAGQGIVRKYYSREAAWNQIASDFI